MEITGQRARVSSRRELARALEPVEGWLAAREAWALYRAARDAPGDAPVAVEIGSWKGRSTIAMALGFRERGAGTVIAIDPHPPRSRQDTFAEFTANVEASGVAEHVRAIRATSVEARPSVTGPVDLLFVDGSHQYLKVLEDIDAWTSALRPGATAAFHDVIGWRGVQRAVRARVLRPGPFRRPRLVQETLLVRFEPGEWSRRDALATAAIRAWLHPATVAHRVVWRLRGRRHPEQASAAPAVPGRDPGAVPPA